MSLWWRWLAAEGDAETVPQLWEGVEQEQEQEQEKDLGLRSGLELGSGAQQVKQGQQCV